jgi:type I restriction enzyme R subunit
MTDEQKVLAHRIAALEARVAELRSFLHSAIGYLSSDPASSLTKSRTILEKVLLALYRGTMRKEPPRPMIGDMLADKAFMANIPRRIAARMNAVRDMSNLGPHGEEVDAADAIRVMRDLIDVLEWYVVHHDPSCQAPGSWAARQSLEILPQLRQKYPRHLRPYPFDEARS